MAAAALRLLIEGRNMGRIPASFCAPQNYAPAPVLRVLILPRAREPLQTGTVTQDFQDPDLTRYFPTVLISGKYGRNETAGLLRPNFGSGAVSEVRSHLPNPFETKRNLGAHLGHVGVCEGKLAEEEALETNALGGEERKRWYDCGKWRSGSLTQVCAQARQTETGRTLALSWSRPASG